ncbi:ABC-F family ATP-binding cassette domain-containing protein [Parapedobacter indicus]|uniref:ATP-binding cassette, subfamily F, uup n=1 Tax=Parapedobacter indicus TaxID=1477437 RepID=A0A1I3KAQ0_9SPHI|nr:ABC-F family ATP-binding cassette domain-containing protein [Parapedobacter indicus]PPL01760.1 ATP-binding cassette subfamily F protein uup [Parapedobacter indicus]SFI69410.1 ATP-binding cassette, subfamily F, uup [Parapedobacter indicus]
MNIVSTERLGHSYHDRWLFKNLHFGLQKGDRVALVGANGTGKSSLLSILAGQLDPLEGIVAKEKGARIGFLSQDPTFNAFKSINDFIYSTDNQQQQLIRAYEELVSDPDADPRKLASLSDQISAIDAWEYEHNIKSILTRLQITDFSQAIDTLSGGQKKRLALAKLLIDEPDVYILDEPTNHLDIETIEWLEKLLTMGQKTVLLVTHDRYFLDAVCTEIRELDKGRITAYSGNYRYYLEKKAEREEAEQVLLERNRNLLRRELEWMRRQPQARGTKSKARIDAFYELEEKTKTQGKQSDLQLSVKISRQGSKILELEKIFKSFGNKLLIENFSYVFKKGDRIGLAGRNGTGKSTFLNLITSVERPDAGNIEVGETTVFGYYRQGGLVVQEEDRVIDVVKSVAEYIRMANGDELTASQLLTLFLFPPEKQFGHVSKLSGGERKRLQLMRVLIQNPNFLILDEPANDLDIDTLNILESFLLNYPGVLLLVSHDRYLLDRLTEQLFIFDGNGKVTIYNGNYADYKEEQAAIAEANKRKIEHRIIETPPSQSDVKRKLTFREREEYKFLDEAIPKLEQEISTQTLALTNTTDHLLLTNIATEIERLNQELDTKTERWLELGEYI